MPFPFPWSTLAHRRLEGPQLGHGLKGLDSINRLRNEFAIAVVGGCVLEHKLQHLRIFGEMFRGSSKEMLQLEAQRVARRCRERPSLLLQERLEDEVMFHLLLQPLFRDRVMSDICRICVSELCCRGEEDITNPQDDWTFFALSDVEDFKEILVAFAEIENVSKDLVDEIFKVSCWDNRRVSSSQRFDKRVFDEIDVLQVLFFSGDNPMNNTRERKDERGQQRSEIWNVCTFASLPLLVAKHSRCWHRWQKPIFHVWVGELALGQGI